MPPAPSPHDPSLDRLARTQRVLALAVGGVVALSAVVVLLLARAPKRLDMSDPALVQQAIQQMMDLGDGFYDSHPDPDVAKVLQPDMAAVPYFGDIVLSTNAFGVRERAWIVPKPEGTVRVVILGDSFVLGSGINADERMGAHLERALRERAPGFEGHVEVLQIGMGSWNVRAECAYARRQLSLLEPDLLIHVLVNNDLDDTLGVRGFGGFATMSPQQPDHVTGVLQRRYPKQTLRGEHTGWLSNGLDWESRSRFAAALEDLKRLQRAVVDRGGAYRILFAWGKFQQPAYHGLGRHFAAEDVDFMSPRFGSRPEHRVSATDGHWGAFGNEQVAKMLYARILGLGLLPTIPLEPWPEADALLRDYLDRGREEATREKPVAEWLDEVPIAPALEFGAALDDAGKAQVHGGLLADGRAHPYASLILASGGDTLRVRARGLPRRELAGVEVRVFLDELQVGTLAPEPGEPLELEVAVPDVLRTREFLSLRFLASDWAYAGPNLRDCLSFRLERVALED